MNTIPDDIVELIMAILPDCRGIGLAAHRFYTIFTGMPDVAYWCSGMDARWLMPKMVPDVWCGSIFEIIRADNLEIFIAATAGVPRDQRVTYMNAAENTDSVRIALHLRAELGITDDPGIYLADAAGIVDALSLLNPWTLVPPRASMKFYIRELVRTYMNLYAANKSYTRSSMLAAATPLLRTWWTKAVHTTRACSMPQIAGLFQNYHIGAYSPAAAWRW